MAQTTENKKEISSKFRDLIGPNPKGQELENVIESAEEKSDQIYKLLIYND